MWPNIVFNVENKTTVCAELIPQLDIENNLNTIYSYAYIHEIYTHQTNVGIAEGQHTPLGIPWHRLLSLDTQVPVQVAFPAVKF